MVGIIALQTAKESRNKKRCAPRGRGTLNPLMRSGDEIGVSGEGVGNCRGGEDIISPSRNLGDPALPSPSLSDARDIIPALSEIISGRRLLTTLL